MIRFLHILASRRPPVRHCAVDHQKLTSTDPFIAINANLALDLTDSAAPEPSTRAMMILGFVGLGFMAHRRKNSPSRLNEHTVQERENSHLAPLVKSITGYSKLSLPPWLAPIEAPQCEQDLTGLASKSDLIPTKAIKGIGW
jgi:hypothetical protein